VAPFLTIITRTYNRPDGLAQCCATVEAQTDQDFEHLIVRDTVGVGVAESNRLFLSVEPQGEYVMMLDDDDLLASPWFVSDLRAAARAYDPDVIVFRMHNAEFGVLPDRFVWQQQPKHGHIGGSCLVVKRHVWDACIWAIATDGKGGGPVYHSDFIYLQEVWTYTRRIHWMDKIQVVVSKVSRGATEGET
jgi:glycosyltransferase involved in cell wall biosynthesis